MKLKIKQFKKSFTQIAKNRFFQISSLIAVAFLLLTMFLPLWRLFPEITEKIAVPLHYNIHFGIDWFGPWQKIFILPIIGAVILLLNSIIAIALWKREKVLSYFFVSVAMIVEMLLFVGMIFVVLLNISYG